MAIRKVKTKTKGVRYYVRMHTGDGNYEMIGAYPTRGAAKEAEAAWLIKTKGRENKRGNEWADFYLEGYKERVKASSYQAGVMAIKCWRKTFGTRTLASIDHTEAEEWARDNAWALTPVNTMLNYAVKRDVLGRNPFAGLAKRGPGRKHIEPLSEKEVHRLAACAKKAHGEGFEAFVLFMAYEGIRPGEAFGLKWDDINFEDETILIRRRLYKADLDLPKSNKAREINLFPEGKEALDTLDRSTEWVFTGKRGGQMNQGTLNYYWQKTSAAFGRDLDPYELRHFCGHHLLVTKGMRDYLVAAQLGHTDGGKLVRELYGHGDHGAIQQIKKAYGENVLPFRRTG